MRTLLKFILGLLFGFKKETVVDPLKDESKPNTTVELVSPAIAGKANRPYMTGPMVMLLAMIRKGESGAAGYNADYRNDDRWTLTNKTFDQVRQLGRSQVTKQGEPSSAIGAYQFLTATLDSLKKSLKLTGNEKFSVALQDDLAIALMIRRGYMDFMHGQMDVYDFANNLAKEWASLPVTTTIKGAHRMLKPGQSYYAGDKLYKALHEPDDVVNALRNLYAAGGV